MIIMSRLQNCYGTSKIRTRSKTLTRQMTVRVNHEEAVVTDEITQKQHHLEGKKAIAKQLTCIMPRRIGPNLGNVVKQTKKSQAAENTKKVVNIIWIVAGS